MCSTRVYTHRQLRGESLKRVVKLGLIWHPSKPNNFIEKWQDKGKGFGASKGSKMWESKFLGKLMVRTRFSKVYVDSSCAVFGPVRVENCLW